MREDFIDEATFWAEPNLWCGEKGKKKCPKFFL